jgi:hypothetical protein
MFLMLGEGQHFSLALGALVHVGGLMGVLFVRGRVRDMAHYPNRAAVNDPM